MQRTMGEDLGEDFEEMIEEIESGRWEEEEGEGRAETGDEDLGWA